ncbi:hypothetical protein EOS_35935 [Caballeronia mineralivorans PML1(12)]|uniref:SPOR domain-containing protein n=1 Tax=Caballeronia mineralivorans PML1(12) TaxID=908627 RepID=A0A0J1CL38_9BURK|nr:type VI secretion protein IcmF/TssM N-terminal domain-containing protein [Caballeronia mineralivorans]KLU21437.1 hypothetical protein EOS_35935 [Caballeronia mineralivorans PML1(12)]
MLKKIARIILGCVLILALAILCWVVALYWDWPLWSGIALFAGVLAAAWLAGRTRRAWLSWRLRRKLLHSSAGAAGVDSIATLDAAWKSGIRLLRRSRLSRMGGALYALPWFLILGATGSGKTTLLTRTRLSSAVRLVSQRQPVEPTQALDWWYFDHSVVLDPAGRISNEGDPDSANGEWQRLLRRFRDSRRREPLNGIVLTISAVSLQNGDLQQLADAGQEARARVDALTRVFEARIPAYVVVTHCDRIPGFVAWGQALPPESRQAPFGVMARGASGGEFVDGVFEGLRERLAEIRIEQGRQGTPDDSAFFFPECIAQIETAVAAYLSPAFDENPYGEVPLLSGLFLTAEVPDGALATGPDRQPAAAPQGWFSHALFDELLPSRRAAYEPLARLRFWQRFLRHRVVLAWLVLCVALATLMTLSYLDSRATLMTVAAREPQAISLCGNLSADLAALGEYGDTIRLLDGRNASLLNRWLPFRSQLVRVSDTFHAKFSAAFEKCALRGGVDAVIGQDLLAVAQRGDDAMIAAYAQHLVRRINLIDAVFAGQPLSALPLPGSELTAIQSMSGAHPSFDAAVPSRFGQLYLDYVRWQGHRDVLSAQRSELRSELTQLSLAARSPSWLVAWADLQGDLAPVTLASFWNIPNRPDLPRIPSAYTTQGYRAISGFLGEVSRASGDTALWRNQRSVFETNFRETLTKTWYRFAVDFDGSRSVLTGEPEWRGALALMLTHEDPYRKLIQAISEVFRNMQKVAPDGPPAPAWAQLAMRLDPLYTASRRETNAPSPSRSAGPLAFFKLANAVGKSVLRPSQVSAFTQVSGARRDMERAGELDQYWGQLATTIEEIEKGSGHALQVAADTYGFSSNASIKEPALIAAARGLDRLESSDVAKAPDDAIVWNLVRGPLAFTLDYVSRSAACTEQKSWEAQVLAPVQGITDPSRLDQALYADNGLVPTFMGGSVNSFVDRDAVRYRPREVMGQRIPFNGLFYAFVSRAQLARVNDDTARQQSDAQRKADQAAQQARDMELRALDQQVNDMSSQIARLTATSGVVRLTAQPTQTSRDATLLPQQSTLTLQCASGTTTLNNYNFPESASFNWAMASCGDVTLNVQFPRVTLTKRWTGPRGFIDFLRATADGEYQFDLMHYPDAQKALADAHVTWIRTPYQQEGQEALLVNFAEADRLSAQLQTLTSRRAALQDAAAQAAASAAQIPVDTIPDLFEPMSDLSTPATVAACWNTSPAYPDGEGIKPEIVPLPSKPPLPVVMRAVAPQQPAHDAAPARKGQQAGGAFDIQVGVFADPARAEASLKSLGLRSETTPMQARSDGTSLYMVRAPGFVDRAEAAAAAGQIGQALDLTPIVVTAQQR